MKKTLSYLIVFLIPFFLFSQKSYVGLSIGPSFPLNDFKKTDLSDSTSGWAKTGVMLEFTYAYRITHNFGVTGVISYSSNKFNTTSYKSALELQHPDTAFSIISETNWGSGGIMIGPYLTFPFTSKLTWDVRGLFGLYGSYSPRVAINPTTEDGQNDLGTFTRQRANAYSYAFMVGTGFKYELANYYILLFADYTTSQLTFNNGSGWDFDDQPFATTFKQDISYLSVTIGVGYFF